MQIENIDNVDRTARLKQKIYQHLSSNEYRKKLTEMANDEPKFPKLEMNLDRMRQEDPELADICIDTPLELTMLSEQVLAEVLKEHQLADNLPQSCKKIRVYF